MNLRIQVFVTGGTFDKAYNELNGNLFFKETHLHEMLHLGRSNLDLSITTLMMKDSLDFVEADRANIASACNASNAERIVITHGTDTMTATAALLTGLTDKVIVFTGSMQPARFRHSDAVFNLGCAIGALQVLPPGVYIAMNGQVAAAHTVTKNRAASRFEPKP